MKFTKILLAVSMLSLAACASTGSNKGQPDWIDGVSKDYPRSAYITGVGVADELAAAQDRARSEVAKTFRVAIDERATDVRSYSQSAGDSEYTAEVERELSTRTRQVLEGVEIAETYTGKAGRIYALAVLNRAHAAMRLRTEINGLDRAANSMMQRARDAADPFSKAKLALDIIDNQERRAVLQSMLQAVDATGRGIPPQWSLAELEADLQAMLARIRLAAEGEDPWRAMLAGTLSDNGFSVVESGEYTVELSVDVVELPRRAQWFWRRGVAVLDISRGEASLGQQRWEFKESATDPQSADMRLREAIARKLDAEVRSAVLDTVRN